MRNLKKIICTMMVVGLVFTTGCGGDKVAIDEATFISTMENLGTEITDKTETMEEFSSATSAQIAYMEEQYQIEYYAFSDETDAQRLYSVSVDNLETASEDASGVAKTNVSMDSYGKYTISMNDTYIVVSRIENTVIYATATSDSKDTVKEILEQMGY